YGALLCGQLEIRERGILCGLRSDDRDWRRLRIAEIFLQRRSELRKGPKDGGLRLLGVVSAHGADWRFVALRHVGIRVPKPFDCAGPLNEGPGNLSFEQRGLALRGATCDFVGVEFALRPVFL